MSERSKKKKSVAMGQMSWLIFLLLLPCIIIKSKLETPKKTYSFIRFATFRTPEVSYYKKNKKPYCSYNNILAYSRYHSNLDFFLYIPSPLPTCHALSQNDKYFYSILSLIWCPKWLNFIKKRGLLSVDDQVDDHNKKSFSQSNFMVFNVI